MSTPRVKNTADVLDAELLQAVGRAELGPLEAVVEDVLAADPDADVAQAVELRAHLADLAADQLVVVDERFVATGPAGRRAGDRQAEMPVAGHGHAVLVDAAER